MNQELFALLAPKGPLGLGGRCLRRRLHLGCGGHALRELAGLACGQADAAPAAGRLGTVDVGSVSVLFFGELDG